MFDRAASFTARRRADELDDEVARALPVFVADAHGAHFTDLDGHDYVDLCLGDTGAMTGHSPEAAVQP